MASTAELYDISRATLYRLLRGERRPKGPCRSCRCAGDEDRDSSLGPDWEDDIVVIGRKPTDGIAPVPAQPFADPDPFAELTFATPLKARFAISEELRLPLGALAEEDRAFIDALLARTPSRPEVMDGIRRRFTSGHRRSR